MNIKIWHLSFCNGYGHGTKENNHFYTEDSPPGAQEVIDRFHEWYGGEPLFDSIDKYTSLNLVKVNKK